MPMYMVCLIGICLYFMAFANFALARQTVSCSHFPEEVLKSPIGPLDGGKVLHLSVEIPLRDRAGLQELTKNIYDPQSADYHHYLTPKDITDRFGPTQADYNAIAAFFKQHGLMVTPYASRTLLGLSGQVKTIDKIFHTNLILYKHPTEKRNFYAPQNCPAVDLDIPITGVAGLEDYTRFRPLVSK